MRIKRTPHCWNSITTDTDAFAIFTAGSCGLALLGSKLWWQKLEQECSGYKRLGIFLQFQYLSGCYNYLLDPRSKHKIVDGNWPSHVHGECWEYAACADAGGVKDLLNVLKLLACASELGVVFLEMQHNALAQYWSETTTRSFRGMHVMCPRLMQMCNSGLRCLTTCVIC